MKSIAVFLVALALAPIAHAYTGPGLGLGVIGTVVGVVFSLLLAVLAVFWYPLKRALKIGKKQAGAEDDTAEEEPEQAVEKASDPQ